MYIKEGLDHNILRAGIFLDEILFTGHDELCKSFSKEMRNEFEMQMFGEIKFIVGLQFQQMKDDIYITM